MIDRSRLGPCLDDRGCLTVLAVDHRDSLRVEFAPDDPDGVPDAVLTRFKIDVVDAFDRRPSAIMLDPELSLELFEPGRLPPGVGSLCALEAQGYLADPKAPTNELLEGWDPARAAAIGASAAKLLVLYRPDRGRITSAQDDLVRAVVEGCGAADLPLFVEPVPYDIADADDRERTVLASVERLSALRPDVIKMPFPAAAERPDHWDRACRAVAGATDLPWAVLSWGAPFDQFVAQVEAACRAGASGFMAGRAIWREAVSATDRAAVLQGVARPRFDELVAATSEARPI